jgi:hypothetical protein
MSFSCPECARDPYKTEQGLMKHMYTKHDWTQEQYVQWVLDTHEQETATPEEKPAVTVVWEEPEPQPKGGNREPPSASATSDSAITGLPPGSEAPVLPPIDEEETIQALMNDPVGRPLLAMIIELNNTIKNLDAAVEANNNSIDYLKAVPAMEPDYMGTLDRWIEKYGWGEGISDLIKRAPAILDRATGGDPAMGELGPDFVNEMKETWREKNELELENMRMHREAMRRGLTPFYLSPEDVDKARAEGFIDEES